MADRRVPLYLMAGGRGSEQRRGADSLLQEFVQRAGAAKPRVAYVGAASGDNAAFRVFISRMLQKAGTGPVALAPLCGRKADPEAARRVLDESDIVFVSGGDVEEGMRVLGEARMLPFLKKLFASGKPFLGVSAGSIMLARTWIRWRDPHDDSTAELFPCMGFAPVLCDTHGEGDEWAELKAALALRPVGSVGYGIVSGSALVVRTDGSLEARGGEVHVFRRRKAGVAQVESLRPEQAEGGARGQ
jgi:cyanophycinase-like exopeptidase